MRVRGRIAGRSGLWELTLDGSLITEMGCVDGGFEETVCTWLTPGLFDLQVNGFAGVSFTDPAVKAADLGRADGLIRERGISRYCPTLLTCGRETACAALASLAEAMEKGMMPGAWAIHVEGPWISPEDGYRGVHQLRYVRDPDAGELGLFQEAAGGRIRLLTLAPERPGALALIRRATAMGIAVSLGHTNADAAQVGEAVAAGARLSTHLFNGCARLIDRHRNVVYAQLAEDGLYGCFIADSHHVPLSTLRVGLRAKGAHRSILVSDVAPMAGLPEGEYEMEGNAVVMRDGGIWVKESWQLSGAARTLDQDVGILARQDEPGIEQVLLMATRNPALAVGEPAWGELDVGRNGPIAAFSWDGAHLVLESRIGF